MKQNLNIFLDLDDTLADTSYFISKEYNFPNYQLYNSFFKKLFNLSKEQKIWQHIKLNPLFWEKIPLKYNAIELVNTSCSITPIEQIFILTALPELIYKKNTAYFEAAKNAKIKWVKQNFPHINEENIFVVFSKEKKIFSNKHNGTSVLIDHNIKNITDWRKNGGVGILIDNKNCPINQLNNLA